VSRPNVLGDDPRVTRLVGGLSVASEHFRRLWARHDVAALAGGRRALSTANYTAVINRGWTPAATADAW
jgi:hypothetical protein